MNPFTRLAGVPSRAMERFVWRMTALVVVLILACGGLILAGLVYMQQGKTAAQSNQTAAQQKTICPFMQVIANSPVPQKPSALGLKILAESRKTYIGLGCSARYGNLHKADPRVVPYLPKGIH